MEEFDWFGVNCDLTNGSLLWLCFWVQPDLGYFLMTTSVICMILVARNCQFSIWWWAWFMWLKADFLLCNKLWSTIIYMFSKVGWKWTWVYYHAENFCNQVSFSITLIYAWGNDEITLIRLIFRPRITISVLYIWFWCCR